MTQLLSKLSSATEYGLVLLDSARRFVTVIRRNFVHKRLNGTSKTKNILELLCDDKND